MDRTITAKRATRARRTAAKPPPVKGAAPRAWAVVRYTGGGAYVFERLLGSAARAEDAAQALRLSAEAGGTAFSVPAELGGRTLTPGKAYRGVYHRPAPGALGIDQYVSVSPAGGACACGERPGSAHTPLDGAAAFEQ